MDNQPTSNTTSQNPHKKKWEKPTIEIIDIASGNIDFGAEGVQFQAQIHSLNISRATARVG